MILRTSDDDRSYKQGFSPVGMGSYWGLLPSLCEAVLALPSAATQSIDASKGGIFTATLTANTTFTFDNFTPGQQALLVLTQDGTGSRTGTFPSGAVFVGGSKTLTTTASAIDTVRILCTSPGVFLCSLLKAYA